jgi:signal transduction histidine kinase
VADDRTFAQLVSLACHDVRTPLATVHGFVKTIERTVELAPPTDRYMEMIAAASAEMAELLDTLSIAARIEAGRYDPARRPTDTLDLARNAAERLADVHVSGEGTQLETDAETADRAVTSLVRCALRHGGLDDVDVVVRGAEIDVSPITPASAPVVLGEDLRDLRAAVAVRALRALGGDATVAGDVLTIRVA